jgi:hypothetical protein
MTALTSVDRSLVNRARALATVRGDEGIAIVTGSSDPDVAFGYAQSLLASLADLAERLAGEGQANEDTRRLNRIREVFAHFNWEFHDRQLALEAIERIVEGGQA